MVSEMSGVAATGRLWGMDQASSVLLAALIIAGALGSLAVFVAGKVRHQKKGRYEIGGVA